VAAAAAAWCGHCRVLQALLRDIGSWNAVVASGCYNQGEVLGDNATAYGNRGVGAMQQQMLYISGKYWV
jgi:hypothetical protein